MPRGIFEGAVGQAPFYHTLLPLVQVLCDDFCKSRPDYDVVPLGLLLLFAIRSSEHLIRRKGKGGFHFPFVKSDHLRVLSQPTDQLDTVA